MQAQTDAAAERAETAYKHSAQAEALQTRAVKAEEQASQLEGWLAEAEEQVLDLVDQPASTAIHVFFGEFCHCRRKPDRLLFCRLGGHPSE